MVVGNGARKLVSKPRGNSSRGRCLSAATSFLLVNYWHLFNSPHDDRRSVSDRRIKHSDFTLATFETTTASVALGKCR